MMLLPENIDIEQSEDYVLSIRITPSVFFFCIYHHDTRDCIALDEIPFTSDIEGLQPIEQIIFESVFLTFPYKKVSVTFVSKEYDLAPQYLIQKEKKNALYNFTHSTPASQILYSIESIQQIVTVYNTEKATYEFLARNLYNPEFYHHSNVMMLSIEQKNKELGDGEKMYLNFHDEFVDVFCYGGHNQILHALTFENENEKSMTYHILNLWDKCGFDQKTTPMYILDGYGIPNMYITTKLKEYIYNIEPLSITSDIESIKTKEVNTALPLDFLIHNAR